MKNMPILFLLALMSLISMGCQEKSKKSSSSSQQSAYCMQNPHAQECYSAATTGTTGGATNQACFQSTNNYWSMPGCPGFCQNYPTHPNCAGTTTGGTTGSTTGGTTGGTTNPYQPVNSNYVAVNWGVKYPYVPQSMNCSPAASPAGISYTAYETRKATMTIRGGTFYDPSSVEAPNYLNTSSLLKSVSGAQTLFSTDSILKVRFKPKAEPEPSQAAPVCYGRSSGASIAGYTKLQFSVTLVGKKIDNTVVREPLGFFEVGLNSCSPTLDLSPYTATYPNGIHLVVEGVRGNKGQFPNTQQEYDQYGFFKVNSFASVRSSECWVLDVEVAADGTKTFD